MVTMVVPSPEQRRRRLPTFFRGAVRHGRVAGRAWTTGARRVAIWLPPVGPTPGCCGRGCSRSR